MGLDIVAISYLIRCSSKEEESLLGGVGLPKNVHYVSKVLSPFDKLEGMEDGFYKETERTEHFEFRAGSYSGFNSWRDLLTGLAHGVSLTELWSMEGCFELSGPFYDLLFFSDCEGKMGSRVSQRLVEDFRSYEERARELSKWLNKVQGTEMGEYWFSSYQKWKKAFEIASCEGIVVFA